MVIKTVYIQPHPSVTGLFLLKQGQVKHHCSLAEFFDAADINNPIVKMSRESLHILIKKSLVHVHGISRQGARAHGGVLLYERQHFIFQFC